MAIYLRLLIFLLFSLLGMVSHAQKSEIRLINSSPDYHETEVRFKLEEYSFTQIETSDGLAQLIHLTESAQIQLKGAPDLPQISRSIVIPDSLEMEIEVVSDDYFDIQDITIAPSLGNYYRDEALKNSDREYTEAFNSQEFYPNHVAKLSKPYLYKNIRGQSITFYPFQYIKETKVLRVHQQITLRIKSTNQKSLINCLPPNLIKQNSTNEASLLKRHFLNYPVSRSSNSFLSERILLVTTNAFLPELSLFIAWKRKCGFEVEIHIIEQIGNANQLKQFVSDKYLTRPFSNLILIGDYAQIPSLIRFGGASDPSFGYILGDDFYPELHVGRISAETIPELNTQLNRIMAYDKAMGMSHFNRFSGIASELGPGDNNEFDFEHIRDIGNQLIQSGYSNADELFDGNQGAADLIGNPNAVQLSDALNAGSGLVMYAGHGIESQFTTTAFGNEDVSSLTNTNQLPFVVSVACLNGDFIQGTCLAESFLRAENNNQAVGAVAAYMSSINQSWNPPMSAQDEMAAIVSGNYPEIIDFSLGSICEMACVKMIDDYGDAGAEMAATWHLFGDPSLNLRTRIPQVIEATYPVSIPINTNEIIINCPIENALLALVQNDILIGTAHVDGGVGIVEVDQLSSLDSILLHISAHNYYPFEGVISVNPSNLAYLALDSVVINDSLANTNNQIDFNEEVYFDIHFSNLGLESANGVNLLISIDSSFVEIVNSQCSFDSIDALSSLHSSACIEVLIPSAIQDQTSFNIHIQFSDSQGNEWNYLEHKIINAPKLQLDSYQVIELEGNLNGSADPAELIQLNVPIFNSGHSVSLSGNLSVSSESNSIVIQNSTIELLPIGINEFSFSTIELFVRSEALRGSIIPIQFQYVFGDLILDTVLTLKIGAIIEDAESNGFTMFNWDTTHAKSWIIDQNVAHLGMSSFRSAQIVNNETSELSILIETMTEDSIRFFYKVSSEYQWDGLKFFINDDLKLEKSGELNWTYFSYPIEAGNHLLKWIYTKDQFVSSGSDAAWIDDIEFPVGSVTSPLQIEENTQVFKVYPNPAKRKISIESSTSLLNLKISITDIQGRLIYSRESFKNDNNLVDLELPNAIVNGVYFLIINGRAHRLMILN